MRETSLQLQFCVAAKLTMIWHASQTLLWYIYTVSEREMRRWLRHTSVSGHTKLVQCCLMGGQWPPTGKYSTNVTAQWLKT